MVLQIPEDWLVFRYYSRNSVLLKVCLQTRELHKRKTDLVKLTILFPMFSLKVDHPYLKSVCFALSFISISLQVFVEFDSHFLGCIPAFLHHSFNCWTSFFVSSSITILFILSPIYVPWKTVSPASGNSF